MRRVTVFLWILSGVGFGMLFGVALVSASADMVRPVMMVGVVITLASLIMAELSTLIQEWLAARRADKKIAAPAQT